MWICLCVEFHARQAQIRHGDLKPDKILRFGPTQENIIGTLQFGDWGLAKYHSMATMLQGEKGQDTTTRYGTPLYEPPKVELGEVKLLGHQYDVWSMGCIVLEIIIWLLWGYQGVQKFHADVNGRGPEKLTCCEIRPDHDTDANRSKAVLRPIVVDWMSKIAEAVCPENTVLGALLNLVRKRLLVVELPPSRGQTVYKKDGQAASRPQTPHEPPGARGSDPGNPVIQVTITSRATSGEFLGILKREVFLESGPSKDSTPPPDWWFRPGLRGQILTLKSRARTDICWECPTPKALRTAPGTRPHWR
ncbi:hypothetical protein B0H67DRAFT_578880 [Lasiosphaeris hirsuta]|uniref:Protein kinase domain-containing protein n=1 Tax=Lasiosphaeris hirsuta TaxID=260670 RepID=A0AA40DV75_9PEZI|nr:hypothetical protein B0H67DRAFT_578880 [Lasiosphaeris hirsuta]